MLGKSKKLVVESTTALVVWVGAMAVTTIIVSVFSRLYDLSSYY